MQRAQEFVAATEAKLAVHGDYIRELEASLAAEQATVTQLQGVKQLLGTDLAGLPSAGLQQLARLHEDGLKRVRALQARQQPSLWQPGHDPPRAASSWCSESHCSWWPTGRHFVEEDSS